MQTENKLANQNRRGFILKAISSCTLCCLAGPKLIALDNDSNPIVSYDEHKFLKDSGLSIQEVYEFAFKEWYIPAMKNLKEQVGHDRFIEMLKKSSDKLQERKDYEGIDYSDRTLTAFADWMKQICDYWSDRITWEVINEDESVFETRFTECLWAKTFREADASEIGYAGVCYQDYSMTKAFNPNLELIRDQTLMEGSDHCHFKWTMKG
ncbi:MAG: L-2-amino-thiazoline-4-carboxylic acid hydrolase [Cyclobacteriaceae bacterium]|jgi:hypothetical protein|nr:L-2-amino-thiazoline-4-carboxylic acid hydrolase [Cyclobacteriaceae bacterium]